MEKEKRIKRHLSWFQSSCQIFHMFLHPNSEENEIAWNFVLFFNEITVIDCKFLAKNSAALEDSGADIESGAKNIKAVSEIFPNSEIAELIVCQKT